MGMYTEIHFNAELREDTPQEVIDVLEYMLDFRGKVKPPIPDHPLFSTPRWEVMLKMSSAYFPAPTHSTLTKEYGNEYTLSVRSNLKNYNDEIEKFVDWIDPYVYAQKGDFLGFYRYEESEEPTLIRKVNEQ